MSAIGFEQVPDPWGSDYTTCAHEWQPVSMVFECQLLDESGRVVIRQPDPDRGRVYIVCLLCASHTSMSTAHRFRLHGTDDLDADGNWPEEATP
jgi:hypothetical protein